MSTTVPAITPDEARAYQQSLRPRRILEDSFPPLMHIAGVDVAYAKASSRACCVISVYTFPDLEEAGFCEVHGEAVFPYIPGLLAFREGPLVEEAWSRLETVPEVLMFDGFGICHPRGAGLATHMGILLDCAGMGVSKTPYVGTFEEPEDVRGSVSPIVFEGEVCGAAVRTRQGVKPVYVSQGHRLSLGTCVEICLRTTRGHRIPEPLRSAHIRAKRCVQRTPQ